MTPEEAKIMIAKKAVREEFVVVIPHPVAVAIVDIYSEISELKREIEDIKKLLAFE